LVKQREQVFHVDHAHDVVEIAVAEGHAAVGAFLDGFEHLSEGLIDQQKIDLCSRGHDLADA